MNKKAEGLLTAAARAVDEDLARFESLTADLGRAPVSSEKALQRARQALESCSEQENKLRASLLAFAEAMPTLQSRQERCMELVAEATQRLAQRHDQRVALLVRVAALGERARDVSSPIAELAEQQSPSSEMLTSIQEVNRRLESAIEEAGEVANAAKADDWADIARDAETLQQQLQAVRNRVLMSQRKLASQAPS